jgi:hypothetical protein
MGIYEDRMETCVESLGMQASAYSLGDVALV